VHVHRHGQALDQAEGPVGAGLQGADDDARDAVNRGRVRAEEAVRIVVLEVPDPLERPVVEDQLQGVGFYQGSSS